MKASARIVAELLPDGRTVCTEMRSQAPLLIRATGSTAWLVSGAGGPLGGDELELALEVRAGARLSIGSVAAMVAQPGPVIPRSHLAITAIVDPGAALDWAPEPTVVIAGAELESRVRITLAPTAELSWHEHFRLGRFQEERGTVFSHLRVERGGLPVVDQLLAAGPAAPPGWDGYAVVARGRDLSSRLTVGLEPAAVGRTVITDTSASGSFMLAEDAFLRVQLDSGAARRSPVQ